MNWKSLTIAAAIFVQSGLLTASNIETFDVGAFDEVVESYLKYGTGKYMIQEEITQINHALQSAYLANLAGAPEEMVIALLLHDVGQIADVNYVGNTDYLHPHHAELGGAWLKYHGFPKKVYTYVRDHAIAKITLCMDVPIYYEQLSEASKISFHFQKEKYEEPEFAHRIQEFRDHPCFQEFQTARMCDDMAKIVGFTHDLTLPSFEEYREMCFRVQKGEGREPRDSHWVQNVRTLYSWMAQDRQSFEELIRSQKEIDFASFFIN